MSPKYSIVIGTAFSHLEDCVKPCIEAILKNTDPELIEIIVVANGCTDGTEEWLKTQPAVKALSYPKALGYARANNEGIRAASGEYIVLLNNDAFLLEQPKNQWLEMLEAPFKEYKNVGVTGPLRGPSAPAGHDFMVFFCVMIPKKVFDEVGLLDEEFGVGGGEDTDWCIRAERLGYEMVQVPYRSQLKSEKSFMVGGFPIYHKGEATVHDLPNWNDIFNSNAMLLAKRYNPAYYQWKLSNDNERAVISNSDDMTKYPREHARYKWAAENIHGKKILEIGCSSGYGLRYLPEDIEYTGIDYDAKVIQYAKEQFGAQNRNFVHADINTVELGQYDTIIAFEVLEHLHNGRELAQKLKEHCKVLLCSCPHDERKGTWGKHHVLHHLTEKDFPQFEYHLLSLKGEFVPRLEKIYLVDGVYKSEGLLLMKWEEGRVYPEFKPIPRILCSISTKDRYDILPLALQAVAMQTLLPDKIVIFDDGEQKDLREHTIYRNIFALFQSRSIQWAVIFGAKKGQHHNHQIANTMGYDFVWRVDDDEIPEHDVLEKLMSHMADDVGAVGGAVVSPGQNEIGGTGKISDIYHTPNVQWAVNQGTMTVEHLYSSFVYRAGVVDYCLDLSPVAHREETIFTHELHLKGYALIVDTSAVTHHYRQDKGGIRSYDSEFFYEHDEKMFSRRMNSWGYCLIHNEHGLGDNLAFLNVVPGLFAKFDFKHMIIGTAYPEVYVGMPSVTTVPVAVSKKFGLEGIYAWMTRKNWRKSLVEAYLEFYHLAPVLSETSKWEDEPKEPSNRHMEESSVGVGA